MTDSEAAAWTRGHAVGERELKAAEKRWQVERAELRAEVDAAKAEIGRKDAVIKDFWERRDEVHQLRAEVERLTTLRPASEHDGKSWAIWYDNDGGSWVPICLAASNTLLECECWTPLPDVKEPK